MQHAYHLANSNALQHSFAKLIALVQEMPWLREASLNLINFFEHFDPSGKKLCQSSNINIAKPFNKMLDE